MELARYLNVLWWFYKHTFKHQKKKYYLYYDYNRH